MGSKTKIDWADATWNPVTGCQHGCEYCYARGIASRFGGATYYSIDEHGKIVESKLISPDDAIHVLGNPVMKGLLCPDGSTKSVKAPYPYYFEPTFHRYLLDKPQRWKKPRNIFVCSMADLFGDWVPDEWIRETFAACEAAPQHKYLFLTKNPQRYRDLAKAGKLPDKPNFWYGSTVERYPEGDSQSCWDAIFCPDYGEGCDRAHTFVSIEPIMGDFKEQGITNNVDWVIVGAETGNRVGKVIPQRKWVENIITLCEIAETPLFMKESIRSIMGTDFRQEFPWEA